MRFLYCSLLTAACFGLTNCATAPDPAEVCTAQWIQPRAEKAIDAIEKDTRGVIKTLTKAADSYAKGKKPGPLQMFMLSNSVDKLTRELKSGRGIKDLRMLRDTCNDPDIVGDSLMTFMKGKGLPDEMIKFVESWPTYKKIIMEEVKSLDSAT